MDFQTENNVDAKDSFANVATNNTALSPQEQEEIERKAFLEELTSWMQEIGKAISKMPVMGYKELDLYQFYKEVQNNGGFTSVTEKVGTWSKIWKKLDNYDASITDASFRLKKNYERFLLDFEYKCFPERRQQLKQKPPKGKRSRSNSASKTDKAAQQNLNRQTQQQIEAVQEQLHPLMLQQQMEQQLLQAQSFQPPAAVVDTSLAGSLEIPTQNDLLFDEEVFSANLANEYKSLNLNGFQNGLQMYVDSYPASTEYSPKVPPKRTKSEYVEHEESLPAAQYDPNFHMFNDNWNFNRCAFDQDRRFGNEDWVNSLN